jgi:hypothetical protein
MSWFAYYYALSGCLVFMWFFYEFNFSRNKAEADDLIADLTWNTGFERKSIKLFLYTMAVIFGWLILPYEVVCSTIGEN